MTKQEDYMFTDNEEKTSVKDGEEKAKGIKEQMEKIAERTASAYERMSKDKTEAEKHDLLVQSIQSAIMMHMLSMALL